jgi:hypothetical protein
MRSAKLAIKTNTTSRIFPGSNVVHANPASPARIASEIHFFVALDIASGIAIHLGRSNTWCTGEDSNLRNSMSGRFTVCCH